MSAKTNSKTVLFIHGLFMSYHGWAGWQKRFEANGYKTVAAHYPLRDKSVAELRAEHPDSKLGVLTLEEVVTHLIKTIETLDEQPILIGHSNGGLLTQILLNRGYGAAGVAIDSAPPKGVLSLKPSFIRSLWPMLNPLIPASRPYMMPLSGFQYAFVNGQPLDQQIAAYESVVPESRTLARGALTNTAKLDFAKPHAPLLMIAGEIDHIIPASLNKTNFKKYSGTSIVDFKEFPGRNHNGYVAPGWEEIADYALDWLKK